MLKKGDRVYIVDSEISSKILSQHGVLPGATGEIIGVDSLPDSLYAYFVQWDREHVTDNDGQVWMRAEEVRFGTGAWKEYVEKL